MLLAGVAKVAGLARADLPSLASNTADVRAGLRRQSDALATAVSEWAAAAESRATTQDGVDPEGGDRGGERRDGCVW